MKIVGSEAAPDWLLFVSGVCGVVAALLVVLVLLILRGGYSERLIGRGGQIAFLVLAVVLFWRGVYILTSPVTTILGTLTPIAIAPVALLMVRLLYADLRRRRRG